MYSKLKLNWLHHWFNNINNTRDAYTTLYRLFRLVTCYDSRPREGYPKLSHQSQANSRPKHHFASYLVFKERSKSETWFYAALGFTSMAFKKNFDTPHRHSLSAQIGIKCLQEIWTWMLELASTSTHSAELLSIFRKKHPEMRSNYPLLDFENRFQENRKSRQFRAKKSVQRPISSRQFCQSSSDDVHEISPLFFYGTILAWGVPTPRTLWLPVIGNSIPTTFFVRAREDNSSNFNLQSFVTE